MKLPGTPTRPVDLLAKVCGPHQTIGSELWQPEAIDEWLRATKDARRWFIPGLLPADSLVLTSGQQKLAMKTWFTMTLAICLATGKQTSLIRPSSAMPVLFIEEEGGAAETRARLLGICKTLGIDPFAKDRPLRNLFWSFRRRVKLDSSAWTRSIMALVKREQIQYIALDALVYMHAGDENKVSDMAPVVDAMQAMRYNGTTVNYLAHLDKTRGDNKKADVDTQVRGSGIVVNAFDQHLAFRRWDRNAATIKLTVRSRGYEEKEYTVAWDIASHTEGQGEQATEVIDRAALSMIEKLDEKDTPALAKKLAAKLEVDHVYSPRELRQIWAVGAKTSKEVMDEMLKDGTLEEKGSSYVFLG